MIKTVTYYLFSNLDMEVLTNYPFFPIFKFSRSNNDVIWLKYFRIAIKDSNNLILSLLCILLHRCRDHRLCPSVHSPFSVSLTQLTTSVYNQNEFTCWWCYSVCVYCAAFKVDYTLETVLAKTWENKESYFKGEQKFT